MKKFLLFSIGPIVSLVLGFLATPIITRIAEPEILGSSAMFIIVINLSIIVSTLGLEQAYTRYYYESKNKYYLLYTCLSGSLLGSLVPIMIVISFYNEITNFLELNAIKTMTFFIIFTFSLIVNIIGKYVQIILRMEQLAFKFSLLQISFKFFELILLFLFIFLTNDILLSLILSQFLNILLTLAIYSPYIKKYIKREKKVAEETNIPFNDMLTYGLPFMASLMLAWLFQNIDKFFLGYFSTAYHLGIYVAAFKIISLLVNFQGIFTTYWLPKALSNYNKDNNDTTFYKNWFDFLNAFLLIIPIMFVIFKDHLILILGSDYREAKELMPFLSLFPVLYILAEVSSIGIMLKKRTKIYFLVNFITLISALILNLLLIPKFGSIGASVSVSLVYLIYFFFRSYFSNILMPMSIIDRRFILKILFVYMYLITDLIIDINIFILVCLGIFVYTLISAREIKKIYYFVTKKEKYL